MARFLKWTPYATVGALTPVSQDNRMNELDDRDDPEYQAFVASMMKYCRCEYDFPCDAVLAGGPCERKRHQGLDDYDFDREHDPFCAASDPYKCHPCDCGDRG